MPIKTVSFAALERTVDELEETGHYVQFVVPANDDTCIVLYRPERAKPKGRETR